MMIIRLLILFFLAGALPVQAGPVLPEAFGTVVRLSMADNVREWPPETIYEHVNGEAELLKRFGAVSLSYALYEGSGETTLSVDLVDLGVPENAFGLLSLYTGCDASPEEISGTLVFIGTYTSYARRGPFFIRVDVDAEDGASLTREFLKVLSGVLPAPEALPPVLGVLQQAARAPCEVGYHPEDVDYDLEAGPGYLWTAPGGQECFARLFPSGDEANTFASKLESKGIETVMTREKAVAWSKTASEGARIYLDKTLDKVVEVVR
ncbi:MAG: DUF6599 family protein [bacterium]|nr:DUF6599 family protein [bacterium]